MNAHKGKVTRLCDAIAKISQPGIISIVKLSHNSSKADSTFCLFDTCNDCGCNNDCSCDVECRKDDRCDLMHICTPTECCDCGSEGQ